MPKKENNRKNFSGYKKWKEEKERRNRTKAQVWIDGTWVHGTPGDVFRIITDRNLETPNAETSAS